MHVPWSIFHRQCYASSKQRIKGFPLHDHDHAEVFWIVEGETVHEVNGTAQRLEAGALVLIRPADRHGFRPTSAGFVIANVGFPEGIRESMLNRLAGTSGRLWGEAECPAPHSLTASQLTTLDAALADLARGRDEAWEIERFLLNLAHLLADGTPSASKVDAGSPPKGAQGSAQGSKEPNSPHNPQSGVAHTPPLLPAWLQRACVEIQEPRYFLGGTQALARLAGRSPGHLAREVRRLTGRRPTDIVNDARMRHAARLLLTTDQTVLTIALDCGFQGLGHFYRAFQSAYGQTPRAFRLRQTLGVPE